MAKENTHMDDAFKRMAEDFKVPYNASFWNAASSKLDDASLDNAFKAAAVNAEVAPVFEPADSIDDMFMDSAFVDASATQTATYDPSMFGQFLAAEGDLAMDEAFNEAAAATVVDYVPHYWNDADEALTNEGLHYEYNSSYWKEAKLLLDKSDRRIFFTKWASVAAILLLVSFGGQNLATVGEPTIDGMQGSTLDKSSATVAEMDVSNSEVDAAQEALLADKDFADYTDLNNPSEQNNNNGLNGGNDLVANNNELVVNPNLINADRDGNPDGNPNLVVNPNVNERDFAKNNIENNFNELTKVSGDPTLINAGNIQSPQIHEIGYAHNTPQIKIEKPQPLGMYSVGLLAQKGIGNKWGEFSFLPTARTGLGVEFLMSSGKQKLQNFEFGGSMMINHIRQSQLGAEERSEVYDVHGNVTKYWRKLQLKDMVFANVNALTNYRFAQKHKLKFGVGLEYLIAVRSNMSYVDDFTSEITTVNNNWGVKDGLKKIDLKFSIGYEFEMSERFAIQVNSNFGIFDKTVDSFMGDTQRDTEMNLMVGLKYNFVKIKK